MKNITIKDLLNHVQTYNSEEVEFIKRTYNYAESLHKGQYRQSGEEYITHPLNVAYILSEMHADKDTVCAGLLHDTLEDTNIKKEDISKLFNEDIANLVDGVTKLAKMNFSSKKEQNLANTRKIITSITKDVRIIIIKLADRLHNMRTLEFKDEFKQKENALETLEIFVPLAYYIGAYRIKSELEDLALRYLKPDEYKKIEEQKLKKEEENQDVLQQMLYNIHKILSDNNIPNEIKLRMKNIYGIYKNKEKGLDQIHDFFALKIMVEEVIECYQSLYLIHSNYHPINSKFKDYICNPKTNMYKSLHTTLFGPEDKLVQAQIRTFDMDKIASFGLTAYWDIEKGKARYTMQEELKTKYQFFNSLIQINTMFGDNQEFISQVKKEIFADKVYVYTSKGIVIELPKGSTILDFAYQTKPELAYKLTSSKVNDEEVSLDYELKNNDRIILITDELSKGPKEEWLNIAKTSNAKRKIKEYL